MQARFAHEHGPQNAMADPGEIARFHDRASDLMRALLDELAGAPDRPRPFPEIEDALGWPHRRIASVLGGVCHLRQTEFGGRRPYHFHDERQSASGRWELWADAEQARALRAAARDWVPIRSPIRLGADAGAAARTGTSSGRAGPWRRRSPSPARS